MADARARGPGVGRRRPRRQDVRYDPDAIAEYATSLRASGSAGKAADILERIAWVAPLDTGPATLLAEWRIELGEPAAALAALDRVLTLEPHDRARALYLKARALALAGDRDGAEAALLDALDIAPAYRDAQKLLLELVRSGS